jgi:hypothetical protein
MNRLVLMVALLTAVSVAQSNDHSPRTLEECKAVAVSWRTATESYRIARDCSFEMLHSRDKQLFSCQTEYPDAAERPTWEKISSDLHSVMESRYREFLEHHKLWNQFLAEDEEQANKRLAEDKETR